MLFYKSKVVFVSTRNNDNNKQDKFNSTISTLALFVAATSWFFVVGFLVNTKSWGLREFAIASYLAGTTVAYYYQVKDGAGK